MAWRDFTVRAISREEAAVVAGRINHKAASRVRSVKQAAISAEVIFQRRFHAKAGLSCFEAKASDAKRSRQREIILLVSEFRIE